MLVYLELTEIDKTIVSKPKAAVVAKPKEVEVTPVPTKEKTEAAQPAVEEKKKKSFFGKPAAGSEKTTGEKKPLGGLKKIFKSRRAE